MPDKPQRVTLSRAKGWRMPENGYVVRRWYRSSLMDGVRLVQPAGRYRTPPVRRSLPAQTKILKPAERVRCNECGAITRTGSATCGPCFEARTFRQHQQRLRNARIIAAASHDSWVFADGFGCNDGYFQDLDRLLDDCAADEIEPPCYVHPCEPTSPPQLDIAHMIECITEEEHEDFDAGDLIGIEELEAAVDRFNAAQKSYSWMWDPGRVIVLDPEAFERLLTHDRHGLPDIRYISRSPEPMLRKKPRGGEPCHADVLPELANREEPS